MADNTTINAGTGGDVIASDDVTTLNGSASSGVKVQRVKVLWGVDGTATDASTTNPLPVKVGDGTNSMPTLDAAARAGFMKITDGTNVVGIDTLHNDNESATENHLMVGSRISGLNQSGTFDTIRANVSTNKAATYTTAQTGTALWTPAAGKAVVITSIQIQSYGTTAGTAQVWFGAAADTAYTRGTDAAIFDGEFAPSATNKPGYALAFPTPQRGTADYVLRVTTTNAQSITVNVWGYEI